MNVRILVADATTAVETHEAVELAYDTLDSGFSIPGGALTVRLTDAPTPTRIEIDSGGQMLWFRTTAQADCIFRSFARGTKHCRTAEHEDA